MKLHVTYRAREKTGIGMDANIDKKGQNSIMKKVYRWEDTPTCSCTSKIPLGEPSCIVATSLFYYYFLSCHIPLKLMELMDCNNSLGEGNVASFNFAIPNLGKGGK